MNKSKRGKMTLIAKEGLKETIEIFFNKMRLMKLSPNLQDLRTDFYSAKLSI